MSAVLAPLFAAVLAWRALRWGWLRLGLTLAAVVVGAIALTGCEPTEPAGTARDRSVQRDASDIVADLLTEPGDPPLVVTRVYRRGALTCFEARDHGPTDQFLRDCAGPDDPADQRAYVARQRKGQPVNDD